MLTHPELERKAQQHKLKPALELLNMMLALGDDFEARGQGRRAEPFN